jgi:hypothetical protein
LRPRALGVDVHSISVAWSRGLVLIQELLALKTAADVLTKSLNDTHVLEPAVILLLTLTCSIADIRF